MFTVTKTTLRVLAMFSLIATLGPLSMQAQARVIFAIPFDFTVGTQSFTAGSYYATTELPSHVIRIKSVQGRSSVVVLGRSNDPGKVAGQATLTFHRYGQRYFLSQFSDYMIGSVLPLSNPEKDLIARRIVPKPFDVVASSRK